VRMRADGVAARRVYARAMSSPAEGSPRARGPRDLEPGRMREAIAERFGMTLAALTPIVGGWDADAVVWSAVDDAGRTWGVKATVRDVAFGLEVAASLARAGTEGVVAPVLALDGRVSADLDGIALVVTPWIDGLDAVEVGADGIDWERLGRALRAIHDLPPPSVPARRRGIRRFDRSPAALLDEVDRLLEDVDEPAASLRERWRAIRPRLRRLARVERHLKRERTPTARVTLHGDPHLGNVVLDADGRPWFIDFDESAVAPREVDLMLVELGVLFSIPIGPEHRRRFREGYGADAAVDELRIVRFGCVRAVEDVASVFRHAIHGAAPVGVDPLASLEGMLGEHGLVTLVERELDRLGLDERSASL
jgi:spectinomycin phosphotransferase